MKKSTYNFILYHDGYGYWYNALSGKFFRLTQALSKKVEPLLDNIEILQEEAKPMYEKLCDSKFIIDDDVDEINVIRKCHQEAVHSKDYFLIILPTLNCNFKCWYCIQEHIPSVMNPETFETLKRHIDYMIEEEKISSLHIDWFGGEPFMYFKKIIEPLSRYAIQKCEQHNIPFMNSATTNGYFINSDVSSLLTDLKFKQFQITLDGEKVFHDKVKFMKGCTSAFEHVLKNINNMLAQNHNIRVLLRINYTHETLSGNIVPEVNEYISEDNRSKATVFLKKVWQEKKDKNFHVVLKQILDDFEKSGYYVSRGDMMPTFTSCYVNKKYYNAINYNGNVVKCTACNDIHKDKTKGNLLSNGHIVWDDSFDVKCQAPTFENEKCLSCKKLPICMGLCPRDHIAGMTHCKKDVVDEIFEESLLDYLIHQYA